VEGSKCQGVARQRVISRVHTAQGHTNVASILVCAGANLSAVNAHGETALDVAKASGHSETAAFLATAALIQDIDKGESRVGAAAFQEWTAAGVAPSAINLTLSGRTPLDAAVSLPTTALSRAASARANE